jgi:glucose/arabinose dehydrogenase/PKD repeat protein
MFQFYFCKQLRKLYCHVYDSLVATPTNLFYHLSGFSCIANLNIKQLLIFSLIGLFFQVQQVYAQTPPAGFSSVLVSSQWNEAVGITFNNNGQKMFVWERTGKVWVVENEQKKLLLDISQEVGGWHDHGLLGFALHPQFDQNGYFYLFYLVDRHYLMNFGTGSYNPNSNNYFSATIARVTRYTATKNATGYQSSGRKIIIGETKSTGIPSLSRSHVTGSLVFGTDGTLLVATGDGSTSSALDVGGISPNSYAAQAIADGIITSKEDVGAFRAQILESMNGKILRIDPETGRGIPSNPFYEPSNPTSIKSKIWAMGLRNPFRMDIKPGTGSHLADEGKPGVLYVGDVGWFAWEEINIVDKPGMNFGWPIFEGLTYNASYNETKTKNFYAPNPLNGSNGCSQPYFYFQDLLKQATPTGTASFTNPCNTTQSIPSSIKTFVHARPILEWNHLQGGPARTGTFSGDRAAEVGIGTAGSPIAGKQFGGTSSTAGTFYTADAYPATYHNSYFHGDYGKGWIKNIALDNTYKPTAVRSFIDSGAVVVSMAVNPADGNLYYVNFGSEIRKIVYSANRQPVAVASASKTFGPSPLSVQFTGSHSSDPEGAPLSYEWNFGDGSSSKSANPSHTFNASSGVPTKYTVILKVKDEKGLTSQTSLVISPNNTPPKVSIVSPANNALYPITSQTTYTLKASVSDTEHSSSQITYQWQTTLHHDEHTHPEPIDTRKEATTTLDPAGCDGDTYFYTISLTVTDAAGLASKDEIKLYPNCGTTSNPPITREFWANVSGTSVSAIPVNTPPTATSQLTQLEGPTNQTDNYGSRIRAFVHPPVSGNYTFYIASDDNSELWLSTDESPANKKKIAYVSGYTSPRQWNKMASQKSVSIALQAGKKYYIEVLHKEGVVGDHLAVGWDLPNLTQERPIPGSRLSPYSNSTASPSFYRAINLNGAALSIDGRAYEASATAANFSFSGRTFANQTISLTPSTDANRSTMIRSSIFATASSPASIAVGALPAGSYELYVYVWEDNTAERYNLSLEGQSIVSNYTSGAAGSWAKLGPFRTNISDGSLNLVASGGAANLSGIELWKVSSSTSNQSPTIAISSPAANATYSAPATITINANAADTDGSISKVEFFQGNTKLGEDSTSPYSFSWANVAAGTYQLTAKATDNAGATKTSSTVQVSVAGLSFFRAINLNGAALSIDGRAYEASATAANFSFSGRTFANQTLSLTPSTDANRSTMIRSSIFATASSPASIAVGALPAGSYELYVYVWEDNTAERYNLSLEGQSIVSNYTSGAAGSWAKLGPFRTNISDGSLNLVASGGAANLSGIELWKVNSSSQRIAVEAESALVDVFPNPFSHSLTIRFQLPGSDDVKVELYYPTGTLAETLFEGKTEAEQQYEVSFQPHTLPDGLYMIRLVTSTKVYTQKVMLMR